ncbi:Uncharacterized protein Adt_24773 [Abeliophyllum distichum]|uniref:Uncharacterized protein n=1 Tax=Abeliophyllum distichum TaxID=126358 RepID=A0ABD1SHK3_9LAMI
MYLGFLKRCINPIKQHNLGFTLPGMARKCESARYHLKLAVVSALLELALIPSFSFGLSPLVDPELEPSDGPMLPTKDSDAFKPFIRCLLVFNFWIPLIHGDHCTFSGMKTGDLEMVDMYSILHRTLESSASLNSSDQFQLVKVFFSCIACKKKVKTSA